jgi:cytochrome c-type biogenesis protein CcmH/NrfG
MDNKFHIIEKKKLKQSIRQFSDQIKIDPQNIEAQTHLAEIYWGLNRFEEAGEYANIALRLDPTMPEPYWILATIEMLKEDPKEYYFAYAEKAYQLAPKSVNALISYGLAQLMKDHTQDGVELLEQAISLDPDNIWAHHNLEVGYERLGDTKKYNEEIRILASIHPTFFTLAQRYWLYLTLGIGKSLFIALTILNIVGFLSAIILKSPLLFLFPIIWWLHWIIFALLQVHAGLYKVGWMRLTIGILFEAIIVLIALWKPI